MYKCKRIIAIIHASLNEVMTPLIIKFKCITGVIPFEVADLASISSKIVNFQKKILELLLRRDANKHKELFERLSKL